MAEAFDLSIYKAAWLPPRLWRVSQRISQLNVTHGAADLTRTFSNKSELKTAVEAHTNYEYRQTCFLSAFDNETHARRWAEYLQRHDPDGPGAYIHAIDTTKLPDDVCVFGTKNLRNRLSIRQSFKHNESHLFLHRIPKQAVVQVHEAVPKVQPAEAHARPPFDSRFLFAAEREDGRHWVADLHGWYDSDEECVERNQVDDMYKTIEGTW